ncbi:hypothetical protein [Gorillibacterium timonense]|uniref:hypothetical protein n=1 Tax=Gorillibacterium timonense TaxID=1689269 RepID=UPI00071D8A06|nr:hypothetical protein [Gorillibacterium timonense]
MQKKWTYVAATALLGTAVFIGSSLTSHTQADSAVQPGSSDDPVVTKSYVDQAVKSAGGSGGGSVGVTNVSVSAGQVLIGNSGTEFIVRTGTTKAYSKDGSGIPDLTDGKDLADGVSVPKNHLLLFPRDGRGIASVTNSIVMVRGTYTIMDKNGNVVGP